MILALNLSFWGGTRLPKAERLDAIVRRYDNERNVYEQYSLPKYDSDISSLVRGSNVKSISDERR